MADLTIHHIDDSTARELPYADGGVKAGFPSPAQEYMDCAIDLNRDLVRHPESTFYARVEGDSMEGAGVSEGDILVVDKLLEVHDGDMAVCVINGEFTVKFVEFHDDSVTLRPANPAYAPITVAEGDRFDVWGVVTYVIHRVHRRPHDRPHRL